jgi:hypothetical protein
VNLFGGNIKYIWPPSRIQEVYSGKFSFPPAMSLYAPGKRTPYCANAAEENRRLWSVWADQADYVIIIGTRPFFADDHVWRPIRQSNSEVWYIGGTGDNSDFPQLEADLGNRLFRVGDRFGEALETLNQRLWTISKG